MGFGWVVDSRWVVDSGSCDFDLKNFEDKIICDSNKGVFNLLKSLLQFCSFY